MDSSKPNPQHPTGNTTDSNHAPNQSASTAADASMDSAVKNKDNNEEQDNQNLTHNLNDEDFGDNVNELEKESIKTLTDDESIVLEELVGKALCGYTDEQTEEILIGLEEKFANLNSEEFHRMKL